MKNFPSRFFEDYHPELEIDHCVPRTISAGDVALYMAVTGSRFALHSSEPLAQAMGFAAMPVEDILVFHIAFGRTVPDLSLNAIANLGYGECVFGAPVFVGDTITARSVITGVKENSNGKTGTVWVHSTATNQRGEMVLDYHRWLMMRKKDARAKPPRAVIPSLASHVPHDKFVLPQTLKPHWNTTASGSEALWDDYDIGETIHHQDGQTIEEAEHQMVTRLYQNNARVHFNQHVEKDGRFGRRIIYGGHVISLARALSCNGLANGWRVAAIHGGRHSAPTFAGDTLYGWSSIEDKQPLNNHWGALRVRTIVAKNDDTMVFPARDDQQWKESIVLDLDYSVLMARTAA